MGTAGQSLALSVALLLGAAACGDGGDPSPRAITSSTNATQARQAEEQAVIDAYLAGLAAYYEAANPPNPLATDLAESHTGGLLESVKELLQGLQAKGSAIRRSPESANHPRVLKILEDTAILEDCAFDADVEFVTETGEVLDDARVFVRNLVRMERIDREWLTAAIESENLEEPCGALAS